MNQNFWIRDTLVRVEVLQSLSEVKQAQIKSLADQFNKLGYIDARTELGPSQQARMSDKQKERFSDIALKAFAIESEVKELLKSDSELEAERLRNIGNIRQQQIDYLTNSIRNLKNCCAHKLASNRDNPTKRTLADYEQQLNLLVS